jgi:quercetin dioxygenase-like cupin family protein
MARFRPEELVDESLAAMGAAGAGRSAAPAELRARLVGSMKRTGRYGVFADRIARLFDLPIETAVKLVAKLERPDIWNPWLEGVEMFPVFPGPRFEGAQCGFGRLAAGARFPHHEHVGDEVTLVLDGGLRNDGDGIEVWRGEELFMPAGSEHGFVVLPGQECIAAVTAIGGVKL